MVLASCAVSRFRETNHEFVQSNECEVVEGPVSSPKVDPVTGEPLVALAVHVSKAALEFAEAEARRYGVPVDSVVDAALLGRAPAPVVVEAAPWPVEATLEALEALSRRLASARRIVAWMRGGSR